MHTLDLHSGTSDDILSLDNIRSVLQRLEDTIVFQLIERAQFARNQKMYEPLAFKELEEKEGWKGTWVEWFLKETESSHAKLRRFEAPDEYPFTDLKQLPKPILASVEYPPLLHPHNINVNNKILDYYTKQIVPNITKKFGEDSDDGHYGSAAIRDVEVLSALSRRIHFGMFVSESKFRSDPASFIPNIHSKNREALAALITKPAVEAALLIRLAEKARVYGQDMNRPASKDDEREREAKIEVEEVVKIYKTFVIPLTKEVEVDYLLTRLQGLSPEEVQRLSNQPPN
ncbi:chorismate mutase [Violaceomyces palustris]|uniref:Chorismate mutase n=1 Tax=Violaceomyces palustris TaxID=1673888 RepID=A0ACD0P5R0_9BASI|nr:chorismate mutase [Violaceomyces palustris]